MSLLKILLIFSLITAHFGQYTNADTVRIFTESDRVASSPHMKSLAKKYAWPLENDVQVLKQFQLFEYPWRGGHTGIDVRAMNGSKVLSPANGKVWFAGSVAGREVLTLEIDNFLLSFDSVTPLVITGQSVQKGQVVANVTNQHCASNCLHIGLRVSGNYLNPLLLFRQLPYSVIHSRSLDF